MQKVVVEAECVSIWCYHGTKEQLFVTLREIEEDGASSEDDKVIKIVFYVTNLAMKDY